MTSVSVSPLQRLTKARATKARATKARATKPRNRFAVRRRVRLIEITADSLALFETYSFTRAGRETIHRPAVNLCSGLCRCTCGDFHFRHEKKNPTVFAPCTSLCKHLVRALGILMARRLLPQSNGQFEAACIHCGQEGAEFEVVDEATGSVVVGFACADCIETRMDDLSDAAPDYPQDYPQRYAQPALGVRAKQEAPCHA